MEVGGDRFSTACEGVLSLREDILKGSFASEVPVLTLHRAQFQILADCGTLLSLRDRGSVTRVHDTSNGERSLRIWSTRFAGQQPSTTWCSMLRLHNSQNIRRNKEELSLPEPGSAYRFGTQPQHLNDRFDATPSWFDNKIPTKYRETTNNRKDEEQKESSDRRT